MTPEERKRAEAELRRRERIALALERLPTLPDSAYVPVSVAAAHDNVGEKTVWRNYPLVKLSGGRVGVRVGFLRHKQPRASIPQAALGDIEAA